MNADASLRSGIATYNDHKQYVTLISSLAIDFGLSVCSGLFKQKMTKTKRFTIRRPGVFSQGEVTIWEEPKYLLLPFLFPARNGKRQNGGSLSLDRVFIFTEPKPPSLVL